MDRFIRYVRTLPGAFWLAILGVLFSLVVFASGVFKEQSGFAVVFMVPGFLTVAVLTAVVQPVARWIAAGIAALMALLFALLAIGFATDPGQAAPGDATLLVAVHTISMVIAGGAAVSDVFAGLRARRELTAASG